MAVQEMFSDATRNPWPQCEQAPASPTASVNGSMVSTEPRSPRRSAMKNTSFGDFGGGLSPGIVEEELYTHEMRSLGLAERGRSSPMARYCSTRHSAPWLRSGCEDAQGARSPSPEAEGRIDGIGRRARRSDRAQAERYGGPVSPYGDEPRVSVPDAQQDRSAPSRREGPYNFAGTDQQGSSFMTRLRSPVDPLPVPGDRAVERQVSVQHLDGLSQTGRGLSPGLDRMRTAPPASRLTTTSGEMGAAIQAHWAEKRQLLTRS